MTRRRVLMTAAGGLACLAAVRACYADGAPPTPLLIPPGAPPLLLQPQTQPGPCGPVGQVSTPEPGTALLVLGALGMGLLAGWRR